MSQAQTFARLDDGESIFFARQLESVKAKTYDKKYTQLKIRSLLPVSFEAGPGAETIKYEQMDQVGVAKIVANYGTDFPRADVRGKEFRSPIKSLGSSYGYSLQDIRAAKFAGKPLDQRKADAARRAIMQQENTIAYFGDVPNALPGWFSNVNIPTVSLPADGAGSLTTFASKITTPDKIVRDLNSVANNPMSISKGVEVADTLLMPITQYTLCASTPRSTTSDTTILKYFLENNPFVKNADWLVELAFATSPSLGSDSMLAYRRDPDAVTLEIPSDFEQLPPQEKGMEFEILCHQRIGGVLIYYPLSMSLAAGL